MQEMYALLVIEDSIRSLGRPKPSKCGEGKSVELALREYPDPLAIVDATEQRVYSFGDDKLQRCYYWGKPILSWLRGPGEGEYREDGHRCQRAGT
jgi:hypothetical protein